MEHEKTVQHFGAGGRTKPKHCDSDTDPLLVIWCHSMTSLMAYEPDGFTMNELFAPSMEIQNKLCSLAVLELKLTVHCDSCTVFIGL